MEELRRERFGTGSLTGQGGTWVRTLPACNPSGGTVLRQSDPDGRQHAGSVRTQAQGSEGGNSCSAIIEIIVGIPFSTPTFKRT
jgi:hypothetical protein